MISLGVVDILSSLYLKHDKQILHNYTGGEKAKMKNRKLMFAVPLMALAAIGAALALGMNQAFAQPAVSTADVAQEGQFDGQYGDQTAPDTPGSPEASTETEHSDSAADTDNVQQ